MPPVIKLLNQSVFLVMILLPGLTSCAFDEAEKRQRFLEGKRNSCYQCELANVDLSLKALDNANLSRAKLQNAVFGAAQLENANFSHADLRQAILRQANLKGANFEGANLFQADFSCGAGSCTYLRNTSFKNANLTGADFRSVGFTVVDEIGLPNVDFTGADLSDANFERSSLKGALLDKAKLCNTTMPDGTILNRNC